MTGFVITATCWLALCSIPLIWIDIKTRRLPNAITIPAYIGTVTLLAAAAADTDQWDCFAAALLSGCALGAFYLALAVALPQGMGLGDAKLAVSLGSLLGWLGWEAVLAATFTAFFLAAVYGMALLVARRSGLGGHIPFGPFMITATLATILMSPSM